MSTAALAEAREENDRMRSMIANIRRKGAEQTESYVRTGVTVATGFALGAAEEKWGDDAAFGMSPSLAVGLVAHGLSMLDVGGKAATPHLMAIGDAGLTCYAFRAGADLMQRYGEDNPSGGTGGTGTGTGTGTHT